MSKKEEFSRTFREQLQQVDQIPPLPESARQLLRLRNQNNVNLDELTDVIEKDPSLSMQVLRYGRQAIYGYGERIESVRQAVSLVMGFDVALHFCLGIASGKALQCQNTGPLSRANIWQQALECATLCQLLAAQCKIADKPNKGLSYLSGLFHNFGYLLFGHMHPEEFAYLNKLITRHPTTDTRALELHSFGISHDMIGMELMQSWGMPEELIHATAEHHFPDYDGKHANYSKLVALSNRLLEYPSMIDNNNNILATEQLMEQLGIKENKAYDALTRTKEQQSEFIEMAQSMVA